MDAWDLEWQDRQNQLDAVERAGKYAEMVEIKDEAEKEAVSKASDLAWDAAKPVIDEYAKSMAKAIIAELSEAPPDALDMVAKRLGVEVDDELLSKEPAMSASECHMVMARAVSDAVYDAVFKALAGNE